MSFWATPWLQPAGCLPAELFHQIHAWLNDPTQRINLELLMVPLSGAITLVAIDPVPRPTWPSDNWLNLLLGRSFSSVWESARISGRYHFASRWSPAVPS